jgi:hypothetical protein
MPSAWPTRSSTRHAGECSRPPSATGAASMTRCTASVSCCSPLKSSSLSGDERGCGPAWPPVTLVVRWPQPGRAKSCSEPSTPPTACWPPGPPWTHFYRWVDGVEVAELTRLARTVGTWEAEILAWHTTDGCSNGPTEAVNLLIKKVKRVGHGFRNFANYRLRLLLHCGVRWQTHRTARLRGRSSRLVGVEPPR